MARMEVKMAQIVDELIKAGFTREEIDIVLIILREEELRNVQSESV